MIAHAGVLVRLSQPLFVLEPDRLVKRREADRTNAAAGAGRGGRGRRRSGAGERSSSRCSRLPSRASVSGSTLPQVMASLAVAPERPPVSGRASVT